MTEPRWLADEMLGRLARYLRFVGCDTDYVQGLPDSAVAARAAREERTLLTRDVRLAAATPGAVLLRSLTIEGQWRELRAARPDVPTQVRFERCSLCNGLLIPAPPGARTASNEPVPPAGAEAYVCARCGHRYWEGSHTAAIRRRLAAWSGERGS